MFRWALHIPSQRHDQRRAQGNTAQEEPQPLAVCLPEPRSAQDTALSAVPCTMTVAGYAELNSQLSGNSSVKCESGPSKLSSPELVHFCAKPGIPVK